MLSLETLPLASPSSEAISPTPLVSRLYGLVCPIYSVTGFLSCGTKVPPKEIFHIQFDDAEMGARRRKQGQESTAHLRLHKSFLIREAWPAFVLRILIYSFKE